MLLLMIVMDVAVATAEAAGNGSTLQVTASAGHLLLLLRCQLTCSVL